MNFQRFAKITISGDLWSYNSETDSFVVSPEPDIAIYDLEIEKQRCIVVASDGLWNVVKPDEAVRIVQRVEERVRLAWSFVFLPNPFGGIVYMYTEVICFMVGLQERMILSNI